MYTLNHRSHEAEATEADADIPQGKTMLAAWNTARWVEEQEALAAAAARRATAAVQHAKRTSGVRSARLAVARAARRHGSWLARLEATLDRILPPGFGSLLGLFLCVSLSLVVISSMLPLVDRI